MKTKHTLENGQIVIFTPLFKEKDKGMPQYFAKDNKWVETNEDMIMSLYSNWVLSKGAERYYDKEGYLVYGICRIIPPNNI